MRKWIDLVSENLADALLEGLTKIGVYTNRTGGKVTMHRNDNDHSHLMLVVDGQVVANHVGSPEELDAKLKADGMQGALIPLTETVLEEDDSGERIAHLIASAASKNECHVAIFRGQPGDGLLTLVQQACADSGLDAHTVLIGGHSNVGQMPTIPGGCIILDVQGGNIPMLLGERNFLKLEHMIVRAKETGRQFIIVVKGEIPFRQQVTNRFPIVEFTGPVGGPDIEDGGIHRIV